MGEKKTVVYSFPENIDKVVDVLPEFLKSMTAFFKQATTTVHDLDALAPGTAVAQVGEFFEAATELLKSYSKSQESKATIPTELKEVKQSLAALSNTVKMIDRRTKGESLKVERPDAVAPGKKGWRDSNTRPHNTQGNMTRRESQSPAVPQLPPLNQLQPQNANQKAGDALHIEGAVTREDPSKKGPAEEMPFNSSLSNQLSTKLKASGT